MDVKTLTLALLASTALAGHAFAQETSASDTGMTPQESSSADTSEEDLADSEADLIDELNIGVLGGENAQDRMTANQCLADYAAERLGVDVNIFTPADYNGVIQGLLGGSLDMAWLGASAYAAIHLQDPETVEPVLVKTNLDGSYSYHSIGFARTDSGITSLEDMEGKVFGFGDPNSTSGYLIPSVEIPAEGESITMEPGEYFSDVVFTGGHEQTIVAVNNGDIDAGVTWADGLGNWEDGYNSGALRKASDAGIVDMNNLVEIWRSKPIPEGPVVLRTELPQEVKDEMVNLVENLHSIDEDCAYGVAAGETAGFRPIGHEAYETIVEVRRREIGG
ncbi:phosphonate ABC transporter substrate-binding protein [Roseivivax halodurans JCM 10272]|uniref:Phosphonate ABC transporter substrate-binding protein n=1 Tax=Roseivivax halodurans JCM 10272 TaxID=1449350 RepID=X7ELM0_9RHOB|nr:phosphonate ABC transporter substrate-binding protein [Roseivivax halodurans]ETX16048.1 phosphonate ABC transporter substrate-binding protein [Roseivivax halodurans JCM 10272]